MGHSTTGHISSMLFQWVTSSMLFQWATVLQDTYLACCSNGSQCYRTHISHAVPMGHSATGHISSMLFQWVTVLQDTYLACCSNGSHLACCSNGPQCYRTHISHAVPMGHSATGHISSMLFQWVTVLQDTYLASCSNGSQCHRTHI